MKSWRAFFNNNGVPPRTELNIPPISLMWPGERPVSRVEVMPWQRDLGLNDIVNRLIIDRRYADFVYQTLVALVTDAEVIRWRQAVMGDFVRNPKLASSIEGLLSRLMHLRQGTSLLGSRSRNLLVETADRLSELELYTGLVVDLQGILQGADLRSKALTTLLENLTMLMNDENFQRLREELPELQRPLQNVASLTIGVNLDNELRPASAMLLSINERHLDERVSWLERLIGTRGENEDLEGGIASLHHLPQNSEMRRFSELFQDLDQLLTQVAQPIARALNRYVRSSGSTLMSLEYELAFFVAAHRLIQQFQDAGIAFCLPEIAPMDARLTSIHNLVNVSLVVRQVDQTVPSDVDFSDQGRIAILTGPNSGGKTTYIQSVGLAQMLFQAGLFIPATSAKMSPVDMILTHYPQLENRQQGRLAEESERLRTIFQCATGYSLVLLNETFSSTASGEAVYLAQDILCGLRAIGVRAIYATHFVELAELIDEIENAIEGDSNLCSLVAGIKLTEDARAVPTYQITRGMPLGRSYAQEIARRHGISLAQILESRQP